MAENGEAAQEIPALVRALQRVSLAESAVLAFAGALVLAGWLLNYQVLMRVLPGFVAMNPLTAVCFVCAGVSLGLFWSAQSRASVLKSHFAQLLAGFIILVSLLKLLGYALHWNFRVDQMLFPLKIEMDQAGVPNRMAPNTAFNFLLSGLVLLSLNASRPSRSRLAQYLSLAVLFGSLLALLGYVYSATYLYGVGSHIPMALHTAGLFLLLSLGLLFAQTDSGPVALFASNTPGGAILRRLLPFAVAVPAILGALWLWSEKRHLLNSEFAFTLVVLLCIAAFIGLIWSNALILNRADGGRRKAEQHLQQAHDQLELKVKERTSELLHANESLRTEIAERLGAEQRLRDKAEETRRLEEQFLRAQRMESLGALASGIAHDLNNALVPILMGSQLLRQAKAAEEQREACLEMILSSGQRCSQMVKQIVSFARGTRSEFTVVHLPPLLKDMIKIARDTFPRSISVRCSAPDDLLGVQGDSTELHQVLMNLCVNARDAMPDGGNLTLTAENLASLPPLSAQTLETRPGPYVLLSVADTGSGMPPELVSRIFEPFFTTKAPDKGSGLGLSTVASIIKRYGGFIDVSTALGKGTTFKIFLPARQDAEKVAAATNGTLPTGRGELILVVDDEMMVLELTRTTLQSYGYRVITAPNGFEAVKCFEAHKAEISLLITDTDMPVLNGLKAIDAINKIKPGLPVVLASGGTRDTEFRERLGSRNLILIKKPYDVCQLLNGVAEALRTKASS